MAFSYKNKKAGVTYYLHQKGRLMFFSKDPSNSVDLPAGFNIVENQKTGLPVLKKA